MLVPQLHLQFMAVPGGQWGQVTQPTEVGGDDVGMLLGSPGVALDGLYLEPCTGNIILEPFIRPIDFGIGQTTQAGAGSSFRDTTWRPTGSRRTTQYNATADTALWTVESTANVIDVDNGGFAVSLYLGAPPKATTDRSKTGIFRRITWASASAAGENRWRATIPYQGAPFLELSTDAGSTWARVETLESSTDLGKLRTAGNVEITLSVMVINAQMVVWLGDGIQRGGTVITDPAGYKAGKVKVEGQGGYTIIGFAHIRHLKTGTLVSYPAPGPPDMVTPDPVVYLHGPDPATLSANTWTVSGDVTTIDSTALEYQYTLTMTAPDEGDGYATTTPWCDQVTVVWPIVYTPPVPDVDKVWLDLEPHLYEERFSFDPATRILSRWHKLTARIYATELHPLHGVDSVRAYLSYKHETDHGEPEALRGVFISATEQRLYSRGRDAFIEEEGYGLLWQVKSGFIRRRFFPSHWCPYAVARMGLEAAGIVPELQLLIPMGNDAMPCHPGPYPSNCPHALFGAHPGFFEMTTSFEILEAAKDVIFGWYGEDATGQFRFQEFRPETYTTVIKAFSEQGTYNADAGTNYDEIGQPIDPGTLVRVRSLSGVKNDITLFGADPQSEDVFSRHWQDTNSITDRGAMNFTGFPRPFAWVDSIFVTDLFTRQAIDSISAWARLPYDEVTLPVAIQPDLYPTPEMNAIITAQESRTIGPAPLPLFVLDVYHRIDGSGAGWGWVRGLWTGQGVLPGTVIPPPRQQPQGPVDVGALPSGARTDDGGAVYAGSAGSGRSGPVGA